LVDDVNVMDPGAGMTAPAHRSAEPVTFRLLGPVQGWVLGREVDLGAPQQRALLAVLLLHDGGFVTVDMLINALWGATPPPSAVTVIRTYVSRLRRAIGGTVAERVRIESMAGGYAIKVPPLSVDVAEFRRLTQEAATASRSDDAASAAEHLRAALALRQGSPLAGLPGRTRKASAAGCSS
jgi:DNA-binding SARP family transcriptional activator